MAKYHCSVQAVWQSISAVCRRTLVAYHGRRQLIFVYHSTSRAYAAPQLCGGCGGLWWCWRRQGPGALTPALAGARGGAGGGALRWRSENLPLAMRMARAAHGSACEWGCACVYAAAEVAGPGAACECAAMHARYHAQLVA